MSRRERIEAMLAEEPGDVFLRYSLALELKKDGNLTQSLELLDQLAREDPPYIPAFFMAGQHLAEGGRYDEARSWLRQGIDSARAQGDSHAAAEMSELLASLGQHGE
jgi:tetratricopeptide (TPR) repeat protein